MQCTMGSLQEHANTVLLKIHDFQLYVLAGELYDFNVNRHY
jgi:hypothetical protein